MTPLVPDAEQIDRRLRQILRRDSRNVGVSADMDRLTVMLTRSCELRCSYCFVAVNEEAHGSDAHESPAQVPVGDLGDARVDATVELLMSSPRPRLALQLFGGEPTRRWDSLERAIRTAVEHPRRRGRALELLVTTNGLGFDPDDPALAARLSVLARREVMVELSIDGDARGSRFRRGHLVTSDAAAERLARVLPLLSRHGVRWFANVTVPPAAAGELVERYRWARALGVPALQLNYATGMPWTEAQVTTYLSSLQEVLFAHAAERSSLELLNWNNGADPVPLCADVIVDTDGSLVQMGAVFHEKRYPELRAAYRRGSLASTRSFEGLRLPLGELYELTRRTLGPDEWAVFDGNTRLGAAVDLVVQLAHRRVRPTR